MKIEVNGLLYDSDDSRCKCIISVACGQVYAFVRVIDLGGGVKQYWGPYTHEFREQPGMMREILKKGGKWPKLPTE